MRDIAFEGKERSIRANIVMPGSIDTRIERHHGRLHAPAQHGPAPIIQGMLIGRPGTSWDTAYLHALPTLAGVRVHHGPGRAINRGLTTI